METENLEIDEIEVEGTEDQSPDDGLVKKLRKQLDAANKAKKSALDDLAKERRESAIAKSGLELNEKQLAGLMAAHGEEALTAESLRATAQELGFIKDAGVTATQEEIDAHQRVGEASASAQNANDPTDVFNAKLQEFIKNNDQQGMLAYLQESGWTEAVPARWKRDAQ